MDNFQRTVINVAVVLLLISLTLIGIIIYRNSYKNIYPPVVAKCPDYWVDTLTDGKSTCVNVKNLGSCNETEMDFSTSFWSGKSGLCNKYQWARKCDVTWDGITTRDDICKK